MDRTRRAVCGRCVRRRPVGYLLAAPVLVFIATMGLGLVGMVTAMGLMGTKVGVADFVPAAITAIVGVAMLLHLLLKIEEPARPAPLSGLRPLISAPAGSPDTGVHNAAGSSLQNGAAKTSQVAEVD